MVLYSEVNGGVCKVIQCPFFYHTPSRSRHCACSWAFKEQNAGNGAFYLSQDPKKL